MNLIRTCTIFFVGTLHCLLLSAQEPIPFSSDAAQLAAPIKNLDQRHQELLAGLSGSLKTELQAEYKKRYAYLKEIYTAEELVTDSTTIHYLQALSQKIIRSNPELGTISTSIHFARAWWPNAISYGEGTILFNINLFSRLENEAQAAFIICLKSSGNNTLKDIPLPDIMLGLFYHIAIFFLGKVAGKFHVLICLFLR